MSEKAHRLLAALIGGRIWLSPASSLPVRRHWAVQVKGWGEQKPVDTPVLGPVQPQASQSR